MYEALARSQHRRIKYPTNRASTARSQGCARLWIHWIHESMNPECRSRIHGFMIHQLRSLTASRAPSHQVQIIPNFSLYWICMVFDHFRYVGDGAFTLRFLGVVDAVLRSFEERIDEKIGLI